MKNTKRWAMILAVTLAALLLFSLLGSLIPNAGAATKLEQLKEQQKALEADKKRAKAKIDEAKKEKKAIFDQKYALDEQMDITLQDIENTQLLIQEYALRIAETEREYMDAVEAEKEKQNKFMMRIRAMEETGDVSYISILMQAKSFSDLLGRISTISEIAEDDRRVLRELRGAQELIAGKKQQFEAEKIEQQENKNLLSDSYQELYEQYEELNGMISSLDSDIKEQETAVQKADAAEKALQDQIKKMIEESQKKNNSAYVGGEFMFPLPDHSFAISSDFGMRPHPILKVNRMHTGVDLSAPTGTPIYAANSGEVILAEYNGGYGRCVVINHGGGVATLYAHCNQLLVKKGATVKKGDKIATVGSTGVSTGPHLHFEIIENGKQINPMSKFTRV